MKQQSQKLITVSEKDRKTMNYCIYHCCINENAMTEACKEGLKKEVCHKQRAKQIINTKQLAAKNQIENHKQRNNCNPVAFSHNFYSKLLVNYLSSLIITPFSFSLCVILS